MSANIEDQLPSREDIVANVIHILSSYTESSPLMGRCSWGGSKGEDNNKVGNGSDKSNISWDLFFSFEESMPDPDSGIATHSNFLYNWLVDFLHILYCHQHTNMGGILVMEDNLIQVINAFIDTSRMDELINTGNVPDDDLLWKAGLDLIKTHVFPHEELDVSMNDGRESSNNGHLSLDPISPHELLRTVMDSYYCKDDGGLQLSELSAIDVQMETERMYRLPTSLAIFFLRTLLICRALEGAEESIPNSTNSTTASIKQKPVRWRRLKSMVDDSLALFQRMVFDYLGSSVNKFEYSRGSKPMDLYPVKPEHVVSISTCLYTNLVFPSGIGLLHQLLRNEWSKKPKPSGTKVIEACYDSFRMLTSLLALEVTLVDQEYNQPSQYMQQVLKCIESQSASDLYYDVISAQKKIVPTTDNDENDGNSDCEENMYIPWKDKYLNGRGLSLEEDLLLLPSIRKLNEKSDQASSASYYDEMGISMIAYWKLWAQTQPLASATLPVEPLPSPYSSSFRWTLLFPHIMTFLCSSRASSTMEKMHELGCLSPYDDNLIGINITIISLGLYMLEALITETPAIRPLDNCKIIRHPVVKWTHSADGLESTIAVLLSHAARINSMEATRGNRPPEEMHPALKFSSVKVLSMTQTLLGFYNPAVQVDTLVKVCQKIKTTQDKVMLPKAMDFMRPLIMSMCQNIQPGTDMPVEVVSGDLRVMTKIPHVLDLLLLDMYNSFDDSTSPLPSQDIVDFLSSLETYSAVCAIVRLMRMWIHRCHSAEGYLRSDAEALEVFSEIVNWMRACLDTVRSFQSSVDRLIDLWQNSEDERPDNWHWLFLMNMALADALAQPGSK